MALDLASYQINIPNPMTTPLKLEVGKFYRTRDGNKAEVASDKLTGPWPILGIVYNEGEVVFRTWTESGGSLTCGGEYCHDLVAPWQEPDPYAELKQAHSDGKCIEINWAKHGQDWQIRKNPDWSLPAKDYRIKPTPDAEGWIPHTPGHCIPCGGDDHIEVKLQSGGKPAQYPKASQFYWTADNNGDNIIAWRPAQKKTVDLDPSDWIEGGPWWVRRKGEHSARSMVIAVDSYGIGINPKGTALVATILWADVTNHERTNDGKTWHPCHKEVA